MLTDVAALQRENAEQRAQMAAMFATQALLVAEIAKLNQRLAELLAVARRKQRKTTSGSSETKPTPPPPNVDADAQKAF